MASVIPTKLSVLLPLVQQQLMGFLKFPQERVIITFSRILPAEQQAEQVLYIRVVSGIPNAIVNMGTGRTDNRVRRRLRITLRTRLALDDPAHAETWWRDHADWEHLLFDAIEGFHPQLPTGDWLVWEEMRVEGVSAAEDTPGFPGIGETSIETLLNYELDISPEIR